MAVDDHGPERRTPRFGLWMTAAAVAVIAALVTAAVAGLLSADDDDGSAQAIAAGGTGDDADPAEPGAGTGDGAGGLSVATTSFGPVGGDGPAMVVTEREATIEVAGSTTDPPAADGSATSTGSTSSSPPVTGPSTTETAVTTSDSASSAMTATTAPATDTTATVPTVTPPTGSGSTTWTAPADDPTQPSPAAVAADRQFRTVPAGHLDCGTAILTSGYPTTTAPAPGRIECIVEAAAASTPAQYAYTARDLANGMTGMLFRVAPGGATQRIEYRVDPDGVVESTTFACAGFGPAPFGSVGPICL